MKYIIHLSFLIFSVLSFGQEINIKTKTIRGYIFENAPFINTPIPVIEACITIRGTDSKTETDRNGKFEIEAKDGDELIISVLGIKSHNIFVTVKNCYIINLNNAIVDYPFMYPGKALRKYKKHLRKIEREVLSNERKGIYKCLD